MNVRIVSLFFALVVQLVYADARDNFVLQDVGKSTRNSFTSSAQGSEMEHVIISSEGLAPEFICYLCLEVSREIEKVFSDPQLPEKVSAFYNDACHILPLDLQVKCVEELEMYANQAILFLQTYFSEENLCNSTGLCSVDANSLAMSGLAKEDQQLSLVDVLINETGENSKLLTKLQMPYFILQRFTNKMSDSRSCAACHDAINDLRDELENFEMKTKVIRILLKVCESVENHIKNCKRMVLEYGPLLFSDLDKYLTNNDVCGMIHICEASTRPTLETNEGFEPLLELQTSFDDDVISK